MTAEAGGPRQRGAAKRWAKSACTPAGNRVSPFERDRDAEVEQPTQIPLGALKVVGVINLWTAGRCISCDHEAQSALRVIGTCLATAQAAGLAAAWYVRHGALPGAADVRAHIEIILAPARIDRVAAGVQRALPGRPGLAPEPDPIATGSSDRAG